MFDWYEPDGLNRCPSCGAPVKNWQGKDGRCILLVFRQGHRNPVEHRVDEDARSPLPIDERLPPVFGFYGACANAHWLDATGYCDESALWVRSELDAA